MTGLLGAWWPYQRARAGSVWRAFFWWQGPGAPVLLLEREGREVVRAEAFAEGSGMVRRLGYSLPLSEPGRYVVRLKGADGSLLLTTLSVGPLPSASGGAAGGRQRVVASFDDGIRLDAYALSAPSVSAGGSLCVTLYWRAETTASRPYSVFVHLLGRTYNAGQGNVLWGQHDGQPAGGLRPVTGWQPGEVIEDTHCFRVDPTAPAGVYQIEVGLYDPANGQRLPVTSGGEGDRLLVGGVEVR